MSLSILTWLFTIILLGTFSKYAIQIFVATYGEDSVPLIKRFSAFLLVWILYLFTLSSLGILNDFSLPPKLPLFVVLPALTAVVIFITRTSTADLLQNTPMFLLIGFQSFRVLVELIIWMGFKNNFLPVETTFEGLNYDVLIGLTALPLAFYTYRDKVSKGLLLFWNIAGLLILANAVRVFIYAGFFPELLDLEEGELGFEFVSIPYLFIAAIFMPIAVFLHGLSIKKLLAD
jgi:hypothetical protein